jgi:hypothetical protein
VGRGPCNSRQLWIFGACIHFFVASLASVLRRKSTHHSDSPAAMSIAVQNEFYSIDTYNQSTLFC